MKKLPIKIQPRMPMIECPNCGENTSLSQSNFMESIKRPELYLIICENCKAEYTLELKEFKRNK